jgi:hypothetical protein
LTFGRRLSNKNSKSKTGCWWPNKKENMKVSLKCKYCVFQAVQVAAVAATIICLNACSHSKAPPKPKPLALSIQPGGDAANLTIRVWVGAASQYDDTLKEEKDLERLIANLKGSAASTEVKSFQLTSAGTNISRGDPIWGVWRDQKRAENLVVIADLPRNQLTDPSLRRTVVPLDKALWKHLPDQTVHIKIFPNEVKRLDTPGI